MNRTRGIVGAVWFLSLALGVATAQAPPGAPAIPAMPAAPATAAPAPGPLLNPKHPLEGMITGGFAGPEGYPMLAQEGYKTYVDLRSDAEVATELAGAAEGAGLRRERVPIAGEADLNLASARALDKLLDDPAVYPVAVACGSGNRVGALLALRAFWLDGVAAEAALDLGRRAGLTKMEPTVRTLLGLPPADAPSLAGTWRLVAYEDRPEGRPAEFPFGKEPKGLLIYDATGRMSIQIMKTPHPGVASGDEDKVTPQEKQDLYDAYVAYFGTYSVDWPRHVVTHRVEADLAHVFIGTDQERPFTLEGDRLTFTPKWNDIQGLRVFERVR